VAGGSEVRWNPNGRELFYIGPNARIMAVAFKPLTVMMNWKLP
jgi:hypothetical protein